jgi:hypothetical protein
MLLLEEEGGPEGRRAAEAEEEDEVDAADPRAATDVPVPLAASAPVRASIDPVPMRDSWDRRIRAPRERKPRRISPERVADTRGKIAPSLSLHERFVNLLRKLYR